MRWLLTHPVSCTVLSQSFMTWVNLRLQSNNNSLNLLNLTHWHIIAQLILYIKLPACFVRTTRLLPHPSHVNLSSKMFLSAGLYRCRSACIVRTTRLLPHSCHVDLSSKMFLRAGLHIWCRSACFVRTTRLLPHPGHVYLSSKMFLSVGLYRYRSVHYSPRTAIGSP